MPCWNPTAPEEVIAAEAAGIDDVGAHVTSVGPQAGDLVDRVRRLRAAGASELHLYHLGLAGPARAPLLRQATDEAHRGG